MSLLCNLTGYGAATLPSIGKDGHDLVLAVTAGRYRLPHPAAPPEQPLDLDDDQPEPPLGDVYCGPPGRSGLRIEGQTAFGRPATDILLAGHARALRDEPVTSLTVTVSVGACAQRAIVVGDRIWESRLAGDAVTLSPPQPFVAMPLVWERAFGGSIYDDTGQLIANEPRNPVGRGFFRDGTAAVGQLLPNVEDPRTPILGPEDRPAPMGFGPIARWWEPRASYAGTYDEAWMRERLPVWPEDFDERFLCAAPAPLQARPHLRGGEWVHLEGLHREGAMHFRLPAPRLVVRFRFNGHDVRRAMIMDALIIEPDTGHITLIHRAAAPAAPTMSAHRETVIRQIQQWEEVVA